MLRYDRKSCQTAMVVSNFTPLRRMDYRVGVPFAGHWRKILDTDASIYAGTGTGSGDHHNEDIGAHGRDQSLRPDLRGQSTMIFLHQEIPAGQAPD